MADTAIETSEETSGKGKKGKKEKGGKSNLVPALVLAAGLLGAGYFMGPGSGETACAADGSPTTTEPPPAGEIASMDPISVNLAEGRFLKVGMAVQLAEGIPANEFAKGEINKAKDLLIDHVAGANMEELSSEEGRTALKEALRDDAKEAFEGEVLDVYFTDFVMQ
jgi:flagellar FliL protein